MRPLNKQQAAKALVSVILEALSNSLAAEDEASAEYFFEGSRRWTLSRVGSEKLREASTIISRTFPKISERTRDRELKGFCLRFASEENLEPSTEVLARTLPQFLDHLESFTDDLTTVYVEISGMNLELVEWKFGGVRFLRGNNTEIERQHSCITTLDGQKPDPLRADQIVAQIQVEAESDYASEYALERVEEVLDVLQFLSLPENPGSWDIEGLCFGLFCSEPIPIVSSRIWSWTSRGPTWSSRSSSPPFIITIPVLKLIVNEKTETLFSKRGCADFDGLLTEAIPSAFDQNLLTAMAWMANAIRERNLARKYLSFYVAIEALFGRDRKEWRQTEGFQKPIVPIPEGVAFMLGRNAENRQKLSNQMNELATTRNRIVHRGYTEIDETDLRLLGSNAWSCCIKAAKSRGNFREDDSFRDWILNRKYGNADSE